MVAAVVSFLTVGAGFTYSPADKFFLHLQVNIFRNNGFVVAFYIVLWNKTVIFNSSFVKKVGSVGLLKQGITDVFLVSENLVDGRSLPAGGVHLFLDCIGSGRCSLEPSALLVLHAARCFER